MRLGQLRNAGPAESGTVGAHAITLEAGRAWETSQWKDSGRLPEAFVNRRAKASGLESPTWEELIDFDCNTQTKNLINADWERPVDLDAWLASMNDEASDLAQTGMQAVDLENVLKRLLVSACGYSLGALMGSLTRVGTPRSLQGCRSGGFARASLENAVLGSWVDYWPPVQALDRDCGFGGNWRLRCAEPDARLEHTRSPAATSPRARGSLDSSPATHWH